MLDGLSETLVLDALDGRARFVGQSRSSDRSRYSELSRGQPQAKSSHAVNPCFAPEGWC